MEPRVFGVPLHGISIEQAEHQIEATDHAVWIVTANPEILLEARRNKVYRETIKRANLLMVDGFGLAAMLRLIGDRVKRVPGIDLAERLIAWGAQRSWRIGLIGSGAGMASVSAERFRKQFSNIQILAEAGGTVGADGREDAHMEEARHRMVMFDPQVLLVGLGHPKQEQWIAEHIKDFPTLRVIVGVGGTFDVWAGALPRAPHWMRVIGLEWLWRLWLQPKRFHRIWDAVIVFPILFLLDLFSFKSKV